MKIRLPEILLVESILFAALWALNDYAAFILTITCSAILFSAFMIALLAEKIEKSKVPKKFFWWLFAAIWPPLIIGGLYTFFIGGEYTWLQDL